MTTTSHGTDAPAHGALVLVVEDEPVIADAVAARLRADGHRVQIAGDGLTAIALCRQLRPDLLVLDLMLPGIDGWEVCRQVQTGDGTGTGTGTDLPILMLTARAEETDVVVGLRLGADDYLTKPFSPRELSARVAALLRRAARTRTAAVTAASLPSATADGQRVRASPLHLSDLHLGDVVVDTVARYVRRAGTPVHLTPTEFDLLVRLADRPGAVLSREQLLADVWGWRGAAGTTRTVDTHVAALRRKLGDAVIRTVHGVGYAGGPG